MDLVVGTLVAGVVTATVSTIGMIIVAVINTRREKANVYEAAADDVQEKRLLLRDEENALLHRQNVALQHQLDDCLSARGVR